MKVSSLFLFAMLALSLCGVPAGAAEYLDHLCPNASVPVQTFLLRTTDAATPLEEGVRLTAAVIAEYKRCMSDKMTSTGGSAGDRVQVSSNVGADSANYAAVRIAQYEVIMGRLQRALKNFPEARAAFQAALDRTREVIDWRAPALLSYSSNNINVRSGSAHDATTGLSDYRETADKIRSAAQSELDRLSGEAPGPAPTQ